MNWKPLLLLAIIATCVHFYLKRRRNLEIARTLEQRRLAWKSERARIDALVQTKGSGVNPIDWNIRRNYVLNRDGHKCVKCGATQNLQVHHIVPRSQCIDHSESNLITLCVYCHSKEDGHGAGVIASHFAFQANRLGYKKVKGRKDYKCVRCKCSIPKGTLAYAEQPSYKNGFRSPGGYRVCISCFSK